MSQRLTLPTIQNWSCHNCGGCCKNHMIVITDEERQRIESQKWTSADGVPGEIFVSTGSQTRLATQADGACVFLNEKGLCKIHAKFGEPAKPLACRVYPYAFHPAGDQVVLSLRFSCPSVVANLGTGIKDQRRDLEELKSNVVPAGAEKIDPPAISPGQRITWPETLAIVSGIAELFADETISLPIRLIRGEFVAKMLAMAKFETVRHERVSELVDILTNASADEVPKSIDEVLEPEGVAKAQFRLMLAQYARKDRFSAGSGGLGYRLKMVLAGLKITRGRGKTPEMQEDLPGVAFEDIARVIVDKDREIDSLWTRYFQIKLTGLHFCGRGFHDLPLAEGLSRLILMYPITMYLARWIAAGLNRSNAKLEDVQKAIAIADHHHGYSPAMAQTNFRTRAQWLMKHQAIAPLIAWMAR